jgi:hypothetical protein
LNSFLGNFDCSSCLFKEPAGEFIEISSLTLSNCLCWSDVLSACKKCCQRFSCWGESLFSCFYVSSI